MKQNYCVYLCGPISGQSYSEATDWRTYVAEKLHESIQPLSPMRHKDYLSHETSIGDQYDEHIMSTQRAITARDRFDTFRADILISNFLDAKKASIGSVIELGWADAKRIPIIVVMEEGNIHDHAMVRELASWIVPTLDEAVMIANRVLVPGV